MVPFLARTLSRFSLNIEIENSYLNLQNLKKFVPLVLKLNLEIFVSEYTTL